MGTVIRATTAKSSKWHLDKHRYLELKHFCLQYPDWVSRYSRLELRASGHGGTSHILPDDTPMVDLVRERLSLRTRIDLVTSTCDLAAGELSPYLLTGVTEGLAYPQLRARFEIPCGREMYYERYRKFFWLLSIRENCSFFNEDV